jgi:hypothetical protein
MSITTASAMRAIIKIPPAPHIGRIRDSANTGLSVPSGFT